MLVVHPRTQSLIDTTVAHRNHAVLLEGKKGVGLGTIAKHLAGDTLTQHITPSNSKGDSDPLSGTISVEVIRGLYGHTRSKYVGHRTIIIDDADRMSVGAQNAFLKLLEEPNESTTFILTTHNSALLLPTIRSRVQGFDILPISSNQTLQMLDTLSVHDQRLRAQYTFIAEGLPAEIMRLHTDEGYRAEKLALMGDARRFLEGSSYEKLSMIQRYCTDKQLALTFIDSLISILKRSLTRSHDPAVIRQLETLADTALSINSNGNIKLNLMRNVI